MSAFDNSVTGGYRFMSKQQWNDIYDIARYNGYSVIQLVNEIHAQNPNANEHELYEAVVQWSKERTTYGNL